MSGQFAASFRSVFDRGQSSRRRLSRKFGFAVITSLDLGLVRRNEAEVLSRLSYLPVVDNDQRLSIVALDEIWGGNVSRNLSLSNGDMRDLLSES